MNTSRRPLRLSVDEAVHAALRGDRLLSTWIMRWLIRGLPHTAQLLENHSSPLVRLNYRDALAVSDRDREIFKPCPILGPAKEELSQRQRATIDALLTSYWDEWVNGDRRVLPSQADVYTAGENPGGESLRSVTVALAFAKYINCDPGYLEDDAYFHLSRSAVKAGLRVESFLCDDIIGDRDVWPAKAPLRKPIGEGLAEFEQFLDRVRPDIVVADGNFVPTDKCLNPQYWAEAKKKFGFKLAILIRDCYDMLPEFSRPWHGVADLLLAFHSPSIQLVDLPNVAVLPSMPFDPDTFEPNATKARVVSFIGSGSRNRGTWVSALAVMGVPVNWKSGADRAKRSATMEEYNREIGDSRITFNNGYVNFYTDILTGRAFEAILSKTLLIQEDSPSIRRYFAPFIHYVPVANVDQFIAYSQFFLESDAWTDRIVNAAFDFWHQHYSSDLAWRFLCGTMLGATPAVSSLVATAG